MENECDMIIKIVILGNSSVGKSNLLLWYSKDKFWSDEWATIGMDFMSKDIEIDNKMIKL